MANYGVFTVGLLNNSFHDEPEKVIPLYSVGETRRVKCWRSGEEKTGSLMRDDLDRLGDDNYLGSVDRTVSCSSRASSGQNQIRLYIFIDALLRKGRLP